MKRKRILFFTCEIVLAIILALFGVLSLKKGYVPLFLASGAGVAICSFFIGYYHSALPKPKKDKKTPSKKASVNTITFWVVLALILLINQSIGIVDLLPDFISYLIIASILNKAAYKAPGFGEARSAFLKLALVNALKLPALIILTASRTTNTLGNDMTTIMSLSFAVFEFIFLISAVRSLFDSLFRLGQRTDAHSLIRPIRIFGFVIQPDSIKTTSLVYAVMRCIFEFFPDLFLLTGTAGDGFTIVTMRPGYPISILFTQVVGNIFGIVWLILISKYLLAIRKEGKFSAALDALELGYSGVGYKTRRLVSKLKLGLTLVFIGALLSIELKFDTFLGINLIPHFIQAIFFAVAIRLIGDFVDKKNIRSLKILALTYLISTVISYAAEIVFMYEFGYRQLLPGINNTSAELSYLIYEIASIIECILLIAFFVAFARAIKQLILNHTAIPPTHERYSRADADYHKAFIRRNTLFCALGILMAISRCANIFVQASIEPFFTTQPIMTLMPAIPWFGLVVFVAAVIYAGFTYYFTSILKEDVEMKYIES